MDIEKQYKLSMENKENEKQKIESTPKKDDEKSNFGTGMT